MTERKPVIAVDGPAAAGKGTLARRIARHLNMAYLDTGLLYRAVGALCLETGADPADAATAVDAALRLRPEHLGRPDLRRDEVAVAASHAASVPAVRAALLDFQRSFATVPPAAAAGAVLDGRDIGSVVCTDAAIKFFVTAADRVRAIRRMRELRGRGLAVGYDRVFRDMRERDERDSARRDAPLRPADDAFIIDTSDLDPDTVFDVAVERIDARLVRASTV